MPRLMLTTLIATALGAASALAVSAPQAQARSPGDVTTMLQTARYAQQSIHPHHRATAHRTTHRRVARSEVVPYGYEPSVTGSLRWPGQAAPYPAGELSPPCYQGPPACTAAGYPNLHYDREIHGGLYGRY